VKALVIGLGVGEQHARAYKEEGLDVVVCDNDPAKLALQPYDKTDDYRTEIRSADIVSVCTPDEYHFQIVSDAINHGCYVVVEKPPCLSLDEMEYLQKHDEKLYCNLPLPFHFKSLIDEFKDKEPYLIECDYNWGRHHKLVEGWRSQGKYSIILGAGLHMFDLMLAFKDGLPEDGAALGSNKSGVDAPFDCVESIMRWTDGTLGRVSLNCGFNGEHEHRVAVYSREYHRIVHNTESVDKTIGIRNFLNQINTGEKIDNSRLWKAMSLCFQLERVASD